MSDRLKVYILTLTHYYDNGNNEDQEILSVWGTEHSAIREGEITAQLNRQWKRDPHVKGRWFKGWAGVLPTEGYREVMEVEEWDLNPGTDLLHRKED